MREHYHLLLALFLPGCVELKMYPENRHLYCVILHNLLIIQPSTYDALELLILVRTQPHLPARAACMYACHWWCSRCMGQIRAACDIPSCHMLSTQDLPVLSEMTQAFAGLEMPHSNRA